jgi:hypothetical protein
MFRPNTYKATLDPEAMNAALEAYELAWAEVMAPSDAYDASLTRDLLAKRIIKAALEDGERDPRRLKAYALEAFRP